MLPDRKIAWGISVEDPIGDIRRLVKPSSWDTLIVSLGSGSAEKVIELQKRLAPASVVGCDLDPSMKMASSAYDDDRAPLPFSFIHEDVARPDNYLIVSREIEKQIAGKDEPVVDAVLANNLLTNLTNHPLDLPTAVFSIAYGLKSGGHVFILDHLLKDAPPFGSPDIQKEYRERYYQAFDAGRPWGDTWTESPPRFVHHFSSTELRDLFPDWLYRWEKFEIKPYIGDSGNETNSFYLILKKIQEVEAEVLLAYYLIKIVVGIIPSCSINPSQERMVKCEHGF